MPSRLLLSLGLLAPACSSTDSMPGEYISVRYQVTPGISVDNPLILKVMPTTCMRAQNQISIQAAQGEAWARIELSGTATTPYQSALQATTQTAGVANIDLLLPTGMTYDANLAFPAQFKTSDPGNALSCVLNLGGPDLFAAFDGDFTCSSLSTASGRKLNLYEGHFHAVPCPNE